MPLKKLSAAALRHARKNARRYPDGRINVSAIVLDCRISSPTFCEWQAKGWPGNGKKPLAAVEQQMVGFPVGMTEKTYLPSEVKAAMRRPAQDEDLIYGREAFARKVGVVVDVVMEWEGACAYFDDKPLPIEKERENPTTGKLCKQVYKLDTARDLLRRMKEASGGRITFKGRVILSATRAARMIIPNSRFLRSLKKKTIKVDSAVHALHRWSTENKNQRSFGRCPHLPDDGKLGKVFPGFYQRFGSPHAWYYEDEILLIKAGILKTLRGEGATGLEHATSNGHPPPASAAAEPTAIKKRNGRGGRPREANSDTIDAECYRVYQKDRLAKKNALRSVKDTLGDDAPGDWSTIRSRAERYAKENNQPFQKRS